MSALAIQTASLPAGGLPDMPIEPGWILEGSPRARGTVLLQSADNKVSSGLWECTAGRFRWTFGWDEFVHVLEGEVTIEQEGGAAVTLKAGDSAHFPVGLQTVWQVPRFVRKVFTVRTSEPLRL
ncbi:MAG: cupin domain-containing protein [Planctomycetales bacterium]